MNPTSQPSKQKWIALGIFCALIATQSCIWNSWGPIAGSAMQAFPSWHKSLVALLSNWGCITYLTCCLPCCWLLYKKGLSVPLRMAAILSTIATFIRCLSSEERTFSVTAHTAAILNGLSGVIVGPATALLSAVWFPRGERTTATGISFACNQLGMAASYLIGPTIVKAPNDYDSSQEDLWMFQTSDRKSYLNPTERPYSTDTRTMSADFDKVNLRVQIMSLMRIEFVGQFLVFLGVLCFYPKEPCQPHGSHMSTRFGLMESLARLLKNKSMWRLCLAAALSQGVTGPWLAMITVAFQTTVTQAEADQLAFWTIVFGSVLSLAAARGIDIFQGHLKIAIYILLMISTAMFLWVLLLDNRLMVFHKNELYAAVILGVSTSWSTPALFLELASEIAFPVSEAIVGGYMIFLSNFVGAVFYFSYFLPGMSERWSSYCVFGSLSVATLLAIYVDDEYNRTIVESQTEYPSWHKAHKVFDKTGQE